MTAERPQEVVYEADADMGELVRLKANQGACGSCVRVFDDFKSAASHMAQEHGWNEVEFVPRCPECDALQMACRYDDCCDAHGGPGAIARLAAAHGVPDYGDGDDW